MKLTVYKENNQVSQIDFENEINRGRGQMSFLIGRNPSCHVVLDSPQVSREFAEIIFNDGLWRIKKCSEFNNLVINGASFSEKLLSAGDMLSIGPYVVNVDLPQIATANLQGRQMPTEETIVGATETLALTEDDATRALSSHDQDLNDDLDDLDDSSDAPPLEDDLSDDLNDDLDDAGLEENLEDLGDSPLEDDLGFETSEDQVEAAAEGAEFASEEFVASESNTEAVDYENDGFAEDGALDVLDDDYGDEKTKVIQAFANFSLEIFGEFAPYDRYKIDKSEIKIGRDPTKVDIILPDPEVSGLHARIRKVGSDLVLEDLQSGNGTLLNGERINKAELHAGDEFLIGSTTFTVRITSDLLKQEEGRLMPVDLNQVVEVEEILEIDPDSDEAADLAGDAFGEGSSVSTSQSLFSKDALKDPVKRKKILYIVVGLLALWVLLEEEPSETPTAPVAKEATATPSQAELLAQKQANDAFAKLSEEEKKFVENTYVLAKARLDQGKYNEAILELEKIFAIVPEYKNARQIQDLAKQGLAKLEEIARKEQQEKEKRERMAKVAELTEKAKEAVKERNSQLAEAVFGEILRLDPENYDVPQMRLELEAWQKEQDRLRLEKATAEAERKRMVDALAPGKASFLAEEWYKSISELEKFLEIKKMDEDLVKDATEMLKRAKEELDKQVNPLLGRARSLKEGQDLKGAYEQYKQILKFNPTQLEALNEMDAIREELFRRSQRVYREAIIAESLSLFDNAKEKFQEVQQISPTDSEYYQKATEKLKNYIY